MDGTVMRSSVCYNAMHTCGPGYVSSFEAGWQSRLAAVASGALTDGGMKTVALLSLPFVWGLTGLHELCRDAFVGVPFTPYT